MAWKEGDLVIAIIVNLDVMLARRKMKLNDLSAAVGVSVPNLSILKTGKARAIRFTTLEAICRVLACQPGDILSFTEEANDSDDRHEEQATDSQ
ncbi:MAG: helix-turn-helix transcriptional regulator [Pirellulaceae bacterium]